MNLTCTDPQPTAISTIELEPGLWTWSAFSPHHKVELRSHACVDRGLISIFDPIPLAAGMIPPLFLGAGQAQIFLTNSNHPRDTVGWLRTVQDHLGETPKIILPEMSPPGVEPLAKLGGWSSVALRGGAEFETAYFHARRGLLVVGDALVNLPPRGLEILPAKYCTDQPLLQRSLQQILELRLRRVLFAHGDSLTGARVQSLYDLIRTLPAVTNRPQ